MAEPVKFLFYDKNAAVPLINRTCHLQLILEASAKTLSTPFQNMKGSNRSEAVLFFHGLCVYHAEFKKKEMVVTQN